MIDLTLSISMAGLEPGAERPWCRRDEGSVDARRTIAWIGSLSRAIQLDATLPGIRPRELDRSGRRELAALLRRTGLALSGVDLFVPPEHFSSPAHVSRAMQAAGGAAELTADLAALMSGDARRVVSFALPKGVPGDVVSSLGAIAQERGIRFADHRVGAVESEHVGVGIDPAAYLLAGEDPAQVAARIGSALASARLSDANEIGRVPVGAGRLDRLAYLVSLHTCGASPAIVDLRGLKDQDAAARTALAGSGPIGR